MKTISAIIPTYNEAPRIEQVLQILCAMKLWQEIIVVDDGSTDDTEDRVKKYPVTYLKSSSNLGKAKAMEQGVDASVADVFFFCDADLKDFSEDQILEILKPVLVGETELSMGAARNNHPHLLFLSGQRAVTRRLWEQVPAFFKKGYRIEVGLNRTALSFFGGYRCVRQTYTHAFKKEKRGYFQGFVSHHWMFVELAVAYLVHRLVYPSREEKARRFQLGKTFLGFFPLAFSVFFFFLGTRVGYQFLLYLSFKERSLEMQESLVDFTHLLIRYYTAELYLILGGVFLSLTLGFVILQVRVLKKQFGSSTFLLKKSLGRG